MEFTSNKKIIDVMGRHVIAMTGVSPDWGGAS
jgi:hypothetical protein